MYLILLPPLISIASKGFWADVLGVGDFYYELGIQIVEICMTTREVNGGLIEMESLVSMLKQKRGVLAGEISRYNYF
jgi:ESCRT-II complex subunit VPS22